MFEKKEVHLGKIARQEMFKGVELLEEAVGSTLGPYGNNVIVELFNGQFITKDGVTVANNVNLKDSLQNLGAQIVRQAAAKTNSTAGDGTTTSTVLAKAFTESGLKALEDRKISATGLKRGMEKAYTFAKEYIDSVKIPVEGDYSLVKQVATISANNDSELGQLVADAFEKAGQDGLVVVEDSKSVETSLEYAEGMQFESGFLSPYFVTDTVKMNCEYKDANILIVNGKIDNFKHLIPAFDLANRSGKPLLLMAHEIDASTIGLLVLNKMKNGFPVVAIKGPSFGNRREEMMKDIAIMTGAKVYTELDSSTLAEVTLEDFGSCEKLIVDKKNTSILNGKGTKESIEKRLEELRAELDRQTLDWSKEQVQQRIAKMTSGVAIIKAGAVTESELKEKKYRLEDAIAAVKAALEDGIVPGAGKMYAQISPELIESLDANTMTPSEVRGYITVANGMLKPLKRMLSNAGYTEEEISDFMTVYGKNSDNMKVGIDIRTGEEVDLFESGIIDPAIVAKEALQNAVSAAGMLLTTNCALTMVDRDEELAGHGIDPSMVAV